MSNYIPLHVQSHYSILQAVPTIDELISQAQKYGLSSFALTDLNNMFGVPEFGKAMVKAGMKPIFGAKINVLDTSRFSFRTRKEQERRPVDTLVLLAQTDEGYRNLLKLISAGYKDASFGRFQVDKNLLEEFSKGLIALSSDHTGYIHRLAREHNIEALDKNLAFFSELYGKDHFFLELHDKEEVDDKIINKLLLEKAESFGLGCIASNTVRTINSYDRILCDIVCAIAEGETLSVMVERNNGKSPIAKGALNETSYTWHEYFKSPQEMELLFRELPQALSNTKLIAEMCEDISFQAKGDQSPQYPIPSGHTTESFLRQKANKALQEKFPKNISPEYQKRLDWELDTVCTMGFPNYFLVVGDFVGFARTNGIFVGPGRGSAAGALLSYVLGITNIDPLKYDLLFERFLNPDRISMPDIDIDFEDDRRDEVKEYLRSAYGTDKTADVITFGYNKAKAVLKDVGRVLEISLPEVNRVSSLIGRGDANESLEKLIKENKIQGLIEILDSPDRIKKAWIEFSILLCDRIRNLGKHASAIIVAGRSLEQIVPLAKDKSNATTTQFEGSYLEENGLLKMDILGLSNLGIIRECLLRIQKERGEVLDIDSIPLDDEKVYKLFGSGRTAGIFQFESDGMTAYLKQLKPSSIDDLIAMNALYRPGPMDNIPQFIKRKNGEEAVDCFHPSLEPILKPTYGVIVYQEQVMQIAQVLCGFSLGAADNVRRIMAKKKPDELEKIHDPWVDGAVQQNYEASLAERLFELLIPFSNYAFNKSHAACYSVLAYQTAWLKANYTPEYMASVMTFNINKDEQMSKYIAEAKVLGISILPPDINKSGIVFEIERNKDNKIVIRYGFKALKGIGDGVAEEIVRERLWGGAFTSIEDFVERTATTQNIRKGSLELLLKAGAFDSCFDKESLSKEKAVYLHNENIDTLYKRFEKKDKTTASVSLFSSEELEAASSDSLNKNVPPLSEQDEYINEVQVFGFSFIGKIFDSIFEKYGKYSTFKDILKETLTPGTLCSIMGHVTKIEIVENGRSKWGRFTVNTENEALSFTLFRDKLDKFLGSKIKEKSFVYVKAKVSEYQRKDGSTARSYDTLDFMVLDQQKPALSELHLLIDQQENAPELQDFLKKLQNQAKQDYQNNARILLKFHIAGQDGFITHSAAPDLRVHYTQDLCQMLDCTQVNSFWFV